MRCYKHSVATRLKRFLESSIFSRRIRFGWNADRKCKAKTNLPVFAACGQNLGEYAAKPNLPGLGSRRLFFLKLTLMGLGDPAPTAWPGVQIIVGFTITLTADG